MVIFISGKLTIIFLMSFLFDIIKQRLSCADKRSAKMYKNTIAMVGIRGFSILISLLSAPVMLHHVDRADYGILLTLTSMVHWIAMMDVGLGNGLRNKLPFYLAHNDYGSAKKAVSSCYAALGIYVGAIIGIFLVCCPFVNWIEVLNSPKSNEQEIMSLTIVVFIAFCFQFLFGLINSILFAYQLPAFQSFFNFLGQIIAFVALLIQVYVFDVTSVFQIGAVNCLIPPIVLLIASFFLFRNRLKEVQPSIKFVDLKSVSGILSLGVKFFVLQIITIVLFQANTIIITRTVGPEAVVEYNMAFKYISVLTMVFNIVVAPIWSATTDAYVRNDYHWIEKTMHTIRRICLLTIIIGGVMVLFSKPIYNLWLGTGIIDISYRTTSLVFLYLSFEMLYKLYGAIINGTGKVFAQMVITGCIAVAYIPLAVFLGKQYGLSGVLIANNLVFFLNYIWSKIQYNKIITQTAHGFWNK